MVKHELRPGPRVAIVTGATSGLGEAAALLFAEEGAKVMVTGRDEARGYEDEGGAGHPLHRSTAGSCR